MKIFSTEHNTIIDWYSTGETIETINYYESEVIVEGLGDNGIEYTGSAYSDQGCITEITCID